MKIIDSIIKKWKGFNYGVKGALNGFYLFYLFLFTLFWFTDDNGVSGELQQFFITPGSLFLIYYEKVTGVDLFSEYTHSTVRGLLILVPLFWGLLGLLPGYLIGLAYGRWKCDRC